MSNPMSWEFFGKNNDGSFFTSRQVEALIALDERDLGGLEWCDGCIYLTSFDTESFGVLSRIYDTLVEWAKINPDATLFVRYRYENAWNPDGFLVKGGKVREVTGHVFYTLDETGEKVEEVW